MQERPQAILSALGYRAVLLFILLGVGAVQLFMREQTPFSIQNYSLTWEELPEQHKTMLYFTTGMIVLVILLKVINSQYDEPELQQQQKLLNLAQQKARMNRRLEQEERAYHQMLSKVKTE